jgi:hypothetical protein
MSTGGALRGLVAEEALSHAQWGRGRVVRLGYSVCCNTHAGTSDRGRWKVPSNIQGEFRCGTVRHGSRVRPNHIRVLDNKPNSNFRGCQAHVLYMCVLGS